MGIETCRNIFKKLKILALMSQYVLSLLIFAVKNTDQFLINSEIHNTNTRHSPNLHLPLANLHICQRGAYYSGIKIFNCLPFNITNISDNPRTFKMALKLLNINSFYSLEILILIVISTHWTS